MSAKTGVTPLRSISWAAERGTRRDLLIAMRDKLWETFHDERTQPRDLSPLTLRIKELSAEIEAIDQADDHEQGAAADAPFDPESI